MNAFMGSSLYLNDLAEELSGLLLKGITGGLLNNDKTLRDCIKTLQQSLYKDENPNRYRVLIDKKFPEMVVYIIQSSYKTKNVQLLYEMLTLLVTITNNSEDFCSALMDINFQDIIIEHTRRYCENVNLKNLMPIVKSYLFITFNVVRCVRFRKYFQLNTKIKLFKELLRSFVSSDNEDMIMVSMVIKAFLYVKDDQDEEFMGDNFDIIDMILRNISIVLNNELTCFNLWELLSGLEALCSIDSLRPKIVDAAEFIPTLVRVISTNSSNPKILEMAALILRNLCSDINIRRTLRQRSDLESIIKALKERGGESVRKIADELLLLLRQAPSREIVDKDGKYDACVSYDIEDRDVVCRVVDRLRHKFKVYVCMGSESELDSVDFVDVLSRSKLVLVAVSMSYQNNRRCLLEAMHASKKCKQIIPLVVMHKFKPYEMLAEIVRSCDGVDFYDRNDLDDSVFRLCHLIDRGLAAPDASREADFVVKMEAMNLSERKVGKPRRRDASECAGGDFRTWSKEEVSCWLSRSKLSEMENKFNEFNGQMLYTLKNMKEMTPEFYLKKLESSLELSFTEILKFDYALDNLATDVPDS